MYCAGFLWVVELVAAARFTASLSEQLGRTGRPTELLSGQIYKVGCLGWNTLIISRPAEPRVVAHVRHVTTYRSFDEHRTNDPASRQNWYQSAIAEVVHGTAGQGAF